MDIMQTIYAKAKAKPMQVAFPEAESEKILRAAAECHKEGICRPVLVGDSEKVTAAAAAFGVDIAALRLVNTADEQLVAQVIESYLKGHHELSEKALKRRSRDPLYVALMMQAVGEVDVTFAGMEHTTGDVILAGQTIVGLKEGIETVSSIGIFNIPDYEGSEGSLLGFGDSAVCVDPTAGELASIAVSACDTVRSLLDWEPRCALLSYSTCGSGSSEKVDKVVEAVGIAHALRPELKIDGEFQLDAAIIPAIAAKKVGRESAVAGKANIIIWPDLNVGNIGVKLVQQFGHADAYGPMLQGFAKIVCDCSRSAPVSELVGNVAMSCVRAQETR